MESSDSESDGPIRTGKPTDREEAEEWVTDIAGERGRFPPGYFDEMSPQKAKKMKKNIKVMREALGRSVFFLATQLYSSHARFVFEMLQNCDDNEYWVAYNNGDDPEIAFRCYKDRIVVECNEDGFTFENLDAICQVGKSSKQTTDRYIGEKGIGFKSVFMVARKVYIQSGHLSFSFDNTKREKEKGMGMVTPIWEDSGEYLGENLTRMTLYLKGDQDEVANTRADIQEQLERLPTSIMLFLRNIRSLKVTIYDDDESLQSELVYATTAPSGSRQIVQRTKKRAIAGGVKRKFKTFRESHTYHITKYMANDLARNVNRPYTSEEEQTKAYARSEVILAFPLDDDGAPLLKPQWYFAFLPVKQFTFQFVIHADFVVEANRQDIVTSSRRNSGLAKAIAHAFVKAVSEFCKHKSLKYQWMRYLPDSRTLLSERDSYWDNVLQNIKSYLNTAPVIERQDAGQLRRLEEVRFIPDDFLDKSSKALLPDVEPYLYASENYEDADLAVLAKLGLSELTLTEILHRVSADLTNRDSQIKKTNQTGDWHDRLAKKLLCAFGDGGENEARNTLLELPIIPLKYSRRWTSAAVEAKDIYFIEIAEGDERIPPGLGWNVVDDKAVTAPHRTMLFHELGIEEASATDVAVAIFNRHRSSSEDAECPSHLKQRTSNEHQRFLFRTYGYWNKYRPDLTRRLHQGRLWLAVVDGETLKRPSQSRIYIDDEDTYGASELSQVIEDGDEPGDGAPGLDLDFLSYIYFHNPPKQSWEYSWDEWFTLQGVHHELYVDDRLSLDGDESEEAGEEPRFSGPSTICLYVAEHRPEKFMGFLNRWHPWGQQPVKIKGQNFNLVEKLKEIEVLCEGGQMCKLRDVYLPTADMKRFADRFLLENEFFPWVQMEDDEEFDSFPADWEALGRVIGLGKNGPTDLDFQLQVLHHLKAANQPPRGMQNPARVFQLYEAIQGRSKFAGSDALFVETLRKSFGHRKKDDKGPPPDAVILSPGTELTPPTWLLPNEAVWAAPIELLASHSLDIVIHDVICTFNNSADLSGRIAESSIENFFTQLVGIRLFKPSDLVNDLKLIKENLYCWGADPMENGRIERIYQALANLNDPERVVTELKSTFSNNALIWGKSDPTDWYKSSQCLWESATSIGGMLIVGESYPHMKDFFVHTLGVKSMSSEMVYEKLLGQLEYDDAKQTIKTFSGILRQEGGHRYDPLELRKTKIFPVKKANGDQCLEDWEFDFILYDQLALYEAFAGSLAALDFTLGEITKIQPFIEWVGLDARYISRLVEERTTVFAAMARPISNASRSIRYRARAILSIAIAYDSPRSKTNPRAFYDLLRKSKTLEIETIISKLRVRQTGRVQTREDKAAMLHIDSSATSLTIYVRKDRKQQALCFINVLPERFATWMMEEGPGNDGRLQANSNADQPSARSVPGDLVLLLHKVLNADPEILPEILGKHRVSLANGYPPDSIDFAEIEADQRDGVVAGPSRDAAVLPANHNGADDGNDSDHLRVGTPSSSISSSRQFRPHERSVSADSRISRATSSLTIREPPLVRVEPAPEPVSERLREYGQLLRKLVRQARHTVFPARGAFDMAAMFAAIQLLAEHDDDGEEDTPYLRPYDQLERDKEIGAAGELFIFELLSSLDPALPNFSRENWESTIRHYAKRHPEYSDMPDRRGPREKADIMYTHDEGVLTELLIDKGYLPADIWQGACGIEYFLEVKATTGSCDAPFYMSKWQYARMQRNSIHGIRIPQRRSDGLYVIFRVYEVASRNVGLRVLVDPEALRRDKVLNFTADQWSIVTPA